MISKGSPSTSGPIWSRRESGHSKSLTSTEDEVSGGDSKILLPKTINVVL